MIRRKLSMELIEVSVSIARGQGSSGTQATIVFSEKCTGSSWALSPPWFWISESVNRTEKTTVPKQLLHHQSVVKSFLGLTTAWPGFSASHGC